jgi:glycosyltransferase involved in cell wall biosynthesis
VRILYLNPIGQIGGAERSLLSTMAAVRFAEPAWELTLLAGGEGPLVREAQSLGVRASVLELPSFLARLGDGGAGGPAGRSSSLLRLSARLAAAGPASVPYLYEVSRRLRDLRPDLIHSNGFKAHLLAALAKSSAMALLWHVHDYASARPVMSRSLRLLRRRCSMAIANSLSVAQDVTGVCGHSLAVRTIHNTVDTRRFSPEGSKLDLDSLSGMTPAGRDTIRVGLVATFARWKGHEVFLNAVSKLPSYPPVRAYVIGAPLYATDGSQFSLRELQDKAKELGIRVGFTGHISDVPAALRSLDIAVHASTVAEPFGLAILEAMSCGRAVICSRAGGALEIFRDGWEAISHEPGDAADLSVALRTLVSNPHMRLTLGRAARKRAEQSFDSSSLHLEWIPAYREALHLSNSCESFTSTAETSTAA